MVRARLTHTGRSSTDDPTTTRSTTASPFPGERGSAGACFITPRRAASRSARPFLGNCSRKHRQPTNNPTINKGEPHDHRHQARTAEIGAQRR